MRHGVRGGTWWLLCNMNRIVSHIKKRAVIRANELECHLYMLWSLLKQHACASECKRQYSSCVFVAAVPMYAMHATLPSIIIKPKYHFKIISFLKLARSEANHLILLSHLYGIPTNIYCSLILVKNEQKMEVYIIGV